jgi:hypothetical protein
MNRRSLPRADNLCTIRDINFICDGERKNTLRELLGEIEKRRFSTGAGHPWTKSNLNEYVSSLVFLKLASRVHGGIFLISYGRRLRKITGDHGTFLQKTLNDVERRFFRETLLSNERFLDFLKIFTDGVLISSAEELAMIGKETSLAEENIRDKVIKMFGYFDKREFSDKGVFINWSLSVELVGMDYDKKTYFPTYDHDISEYVFLHALYDAYNRLKDERTLRAEVYRVRTEVCKKLKIPDSFFRDKLWTLNAQAPHIVSLERAPLMKFGSTKYGLISKNSETYYYLRLGGKPNDISIPFKRKNIRD